MTLPEQTSTPCPPHIPPAGDRQQITDEEHLRLLSIFHYVLAGLAGAGIVFLVFHFAVVSTVLLHPVFLKATAPPPMPPFFVTMMMFFYLFMGVLLAMACCLNLLSGFYIGKRIHRTFSLVVAGLNCLQVPFGTVLGVFTIMVLSRDSVRVRYLS